MLQPRIAGGDGVEVEPLVEIDAEHSVPDQMLDVGERECGGAVVDHGPGLADGPTVRENTHDVLDDFVSRMAPAVAGSTEEVEVPRENGIRLVENLVTPTDGGADPGSLGELRLRVCSHPGERLDVVHDLVAVAVYGEEVGIVPDGASAGTELNRPGSGGGSQSMEDESHGSTQEVRRRVA